MLWENSINLNSQWVNDYEETFESKLYKDFLKINREQNHLVNRFKKSNEIQPNIMQEEALMSLKNLEILERRKD